MQTDRSPIIRANQTHPVSGRDREAATIAGLPEAGSVPQLNRAITRKAALFNRVSNELSSDIWSHAPSGLHIDRSDQSALRYSEARRTAYGRGPMRPIGISDDSPRALRLGAADDAPLAPLTAHQPRPARDAADALERRSVTHRSCRVQEGGRAAERDPTRGVVQLAHD